MLTGYIVSQDGSTPQLTSTKPLGLAARILATVQGRTREELIERARRFAEERGIGHVHNVHCDMKKCTKP